MTELATTLKRRTHGTPCQSCDLMVNSSCLINQLRVRFQQQQEPLLRMVVQRKVTLLRCRPTQVKGEGFVTSIDYLLMDAKQAILDEQHRRFQDLHRERRWAEALQQLHVTLSCASDLLNESLRVLDETIENCHASSSNDSHPTT